MNDLPMIMYEGGVKEREKSGTQDGRVLRALAAQVCYGFSVVMRRDFHLNGYVRPLKVV